MGLLKKSNKNHINNFDIWFDEIKSSTDTNRFSTLFIELIELLRSRRDPTESVDKMNYLLDKAQMDKALTESMQQMFLYIFNTKDIQSIFTNVGILSSGTFFSEFFHQLRYKIIPPLPEKRSLNYLLERAFYRNDDYKWVNAIKDTQWAAFFNLVAGGLDKSNISFKNNIANTITILSYRVSYLGFEYEIANFLKSNEDEASPFTEQNRLITTFIYLVEREHTNEHLLLDASKKVIEQLEKCQEVIENIKKNTPKNGTSLSQSYILLRTEQQIRRIKLLIRFLSPEELPEQSLTNIVILFKTVIEHINKRYSLRDLYKKNSGMLAYQVAEHKSASGEHYITTTRPQYAKFFYSAAAGGFIIAFAAIMKAILHKLNSAPFWEYFLYGLNYAIAFVVIYFTGSSLATKQPTMTASALAGSLDTRKGGVSLKSFSITFAKVWRSQFASFAGNLVVAFPMAYILSVVYYSITGTTLLSGDEESLKALRDQNPLESLAWLYACFTGILLFTSGIITGYVDNKVIYGHIGKRIKEHGGLKRFVRGKSLNTFGNFVSKHLGGIIGNVALGFMLAYSTLFGNFFGIPFDIRHITISTAYFAFGIDGLDNQLAAYDWIWTTIGVIGIGFFNFFISFSLAFYVAARSRNVSLKKLPLILKLIFKYFRKYPVDFIYPPVEERKAEEIYPADMGNIKKKSVF